MQEKQDRLLGILPDVRIRDPFILPDPATRTYYLVTSRTWLAAGSQGVDVYTSPDLRAWSGPRPVFEVPQSFWGDQAVWAPEMHAYRGRYYLFMTFTGQELAPRPPNWSKLEQRGTQVLVADSPLGPFLPFQNRAHTPADWMALDGTLWVEDGQPYMVFCHEWIQVKDGTMELVRLKDDLSDIEGEPVTLFRASEAPWGTGLRNRDGAYVTDGPFLYRTRTGDLLMIWSSFGAGGYTTGIAYSETGKVRGPWKQQAKPLFAADGGHSMILRSFDGALLLTLHQPNRNPDERAYLLPLQDLGDTLRIAGT